MRERQDKVKQKDAVKNSGPVTSTGPSKDRGPLYYFLFHAISTECFEMSETEARIKIIYISRHLRKEKELNFSLQRRLFSFVARLTCTFLFGKWETIQRQQDERKITTCPGVNHTSNKRKEKRQFFHSFYTSTKRVRRYTRKSPRLLVFFTFNYKDHQGPRDICRDCVKEKKIMSLVLLAKGVTHRAKRV